MNGLDLSQWLAGCTLLYTSMVLGLWQILSAPDQPNYPTSGAVKRSFMFVYMAALAALGIETLNSPHHVELSVTAVQATVLQAGLFTTFLVDHVRNWLPARTHQRIRTMIKIASCKPAIKKAETQGGTKSQPIG